MCFIRTNIVIDDELVENALKAIDIATKKEAVAQGLKLLIKRKQRQEIWRLRGKVKVKANKRDMPYQSLIKAWLTEDVKP